MRKRKARSDKGRAKLDRMLRAELMAIKHMVGRPKARAELKRKAWAKWDKGQARKRQEAERARAKDFGMGMDRRGTMADDDEVPGLRAVRMMGAGEAEAERAIEAHFEIEKRRAARARKTELQRERRARFRHLRMIHTRVKLGLPMPLGYRPRVAPVPWAEIALPCRVAPMPWLDIALPKD